MASADARPIPRKNVAYRVTFPIMDADGDLVEGASGLDSEVSIDGAAFVDCTNEATEIAGQASPPTSGMYYLDLNAAEMNGDTVAIIVKSAEGKTVPIVLYPEEAGDIRADLIDGAITASKIASGALTAAKFAAGAFDAVWSVAARLLTAGTNIVLAKGVGVTGFNDLAAADVRDAVGLESANLDTQLGDIETDTQDIQTRLPAALVSGRMSSDIRAVNGTAVGGSGTEGNPWGPAS
jgi:hypothetical protein